MGEDATKYAAGRLMVVVGPCPLSRTILELGLAPRLYADHLGAERGAVNYKA